MFSKIPSLSTAKKNLKGPTIYYPLSAIPQHRLSNALSNTKKINPMSERKHVLESRKLSDKKFHDQCINKIINFCSLKGVEYKKQNFIFLSSKDVENLFIFLFAQLDIKIKPNNKPNVDLEILKILRDLGYPYMLNKSSLTNNGTPKSKGTILSMMCFVLDIINPFNKYDASKILFNRENENLDYNSIILNSVLSFDEEKKCKKFQKIHDDVTNVNNEFERIKKNCEEKENEIKRIDSEMDQLNKSKSQSKAFENQYAEFKKYKEDMINYVKKSSDENNDLLSKIEQINQEFISLENKKIELSEQIKNQKYTVSEIQYMVQREKQIEKEIAKIQNQIKESKDRFYQDKLKSNELEDNLTGKFYNFIAWLNFFKRNFISNFDSSFQFEVINFLENEKHKKIIQLFEKPDFSKEDDFNKDEILKFIKNILKLLENDYENLKNFIEDKKNDLKKEIDDNLDLKNKIEIVEIKKKKMNEKYEKELNDYIMIDEKLDLENETLKSKLNIINSSKKQYKLNLSDQIINTGERLKKLKLDFDYQQKYVFNFFEINLELLNKLIKNTSEQFNKINLSDKLEKIIKDEEDFFKQLKQKLQFLNKL